MEEVEQVSPATERVTASPMLVCANCESPLSGRYCGNCGQAARSLHVGLHDFVHEAVHELLHVDGKIARTMYLLLRRPGQLTADFLAGKRNRYVSPLRLYLTWSALFFALAFALGPKDFVAVRFTKTTKDTGTKTTQTADSPAASDEAGSLSARLLRGMKKLDGPDKLGELVLHDIPKAMFVLMPFFALLLFLFERRHEPYFIPHLYFSVHYHAFTFVVSTCTGLLAVTKLAVAQQAAQLGQIVVMVYLYLALRRVYGDSRLKTLGKTVAIGLLYVIGLSIVMLSILVYRLINL